MNPLLIAALAVGAFFLLSNKGRFPTPFRIGAVPASPPGPSAAQDRTGRQLPWGDAISKIIPGVGSGATGSPNAGVTTVNGALVVTNNALGLFDKIWQYTDSSNADSDYPVNSNGYTAVSYNETPSPDYYSDYYTGDASTFTGDYT